MNSRKNNRRPWQTPPQPAVVVDPRTASLPRQRGEEIFKLMEAVVKPMNRNWDNPEDDVLIRKDL